MYGTEHTVRTANNKIAHRNLISTRIAFQRSSKKNKSPNEYKLRRPGGKYVSAWERARMMEEGIISESKSKVRKVELDEEDSHFD